MVMSSERLRCERIEVVKGKQIEVDQAIARNNKETRNLYSEYANAQWLNDGMGGIEYIMKAFRRL
jgi:hypothetical protein